MSDIDAPAALELKVNSSTAELAPVRRQIEAFCKAAGFDEMAIGDIGLCVNEAMANIIRHAYRGEDHHPIEVNATFAGGKLVVALRDWGTGLPPGPLPHEKHDPMRPGGLGLICLGRLMDKVTFTPQKPGMLLEMTRYRDRNQLHSGTPTISTKM